MKYKQPKKNIEAAQIFRVKFNSNKKVLKNDSTYLLIELNVLIYVFLFEEEPIFF